MVNSILITGATGKLGQEIAIGFSKLNCNLILPIRTIQAAEKLKAECMHAGASSVAILPIDLISENSAIELCAEIERLSLKPTLLINNARSIDFLKIDDGIVSRENFQNEFTLDVIVPYELTMRLSNLPSFSLRKVINIASIYGIVAPNLNLYENPEQQSPINYGVAKAALIHLTKELAVRLAPKNIMVNAVSYGGVQGRVDENFKQNYSKLCPLKRMLSHEDILGPLKFLASNDSKCITGHNLIVDGGWSIW